MPQHTLNENNQKDLTGLTDYDIFDLYGRLIEKFAEVSSKADLESGRCFQLAKQGWEESIKARYNYRKEYSDKDSKR